MPVIVTGMPGAMFHRFPQPASRTRTGPSDAESRTALPRMAFSSSSRITGAGRALAAMPGYASQGRVASQHAPPRRGRHTSRGLPRASATHGHQIVGLAAGGDADQPEADHALEVPQPFRQLGGMGAVHHV